MSLPNFNHQNAQSMVDPLLAVADNLHVQLVRLYANPSASAAEIVAINLEGLRRHLLQLADTIRREMHDGTL